MGNYCFCDHHCCCEVVFMNCVVICASEVISMAINYFVFKYFDVFYGFLLSIFFFSYLERIVICLVFGEKGNKALLIYDLFTKVAGSKNTSRASQTLAHSAIYTKKRAPKILLDQIGDNCR